MNIALIGATGFVGTALLQELLARGHHVRALQRDAAKLAAAGPNLEVRAVDVLASNNLAAELAGVDAVVSAFNAGWRNPNLHDDFLRGSDAIAAAAREAGVRLVVVGGAGSLFIAGQQIVDSPTFPAEWKQGALAAREALNRLRADAAGLDWTFVSPAMHLEPGERTGRFRLGGDEPVFGAQGENRISVPDLAVAIVNELETPQHRRARFTAGY